MLTVEWFGLPDAESGTPSSSTYGFKGRSNDTLRQAWMGKVVTFCEEVGMRVPATTRRANVRPRRAVSSPLRCPRQALGYEDGQISWDQVLERWKARGPMNKEYVASLQRGWTPRHERRVLARLWQALREVEDPEIPVSVVDMGLIVSLVSRRRRHRACYVYGDGLPRHGHDPGRHPAAAAARAGRGGRRNGGDLGSVWSRERLSDAARDAMREWGSRCAGSKAAASLARTGAPQVRRAAVSGRHVCADDAEMAALFAPSVYDEHPWIEMVVAPREAVRGVIAS